MIQIEIAIEIDNNCAVPFDFDRDFDFDGGRFFWTLLVITPNAIALPHASPSPARSCVLNLAWYLRYSPRNW